jgi:hypothetical protein
MKTLGRILIILATFALVMGITYVVVGAANAARASMGVPAFERDGEGFPRPEGAQPQFPNGQRPEFQGGEGRESRGGRGGFRWILGAVKNIGIIAIIVALVVWLKDYLEKRKKTGQQVAK